ncbi:MAG TPA: hypothetical protein VF655_11840 [Allosphingosinicella sp.]|jgi:hypothetical protein
MTLPLALLLIAAAPPAAAPPPPGLQFGYFRMLAFQQRARELHCGAGDLDSQFAAIRKKLVARYGKAVFGTPKMPKGGPGDCSVALSVYRVNLADFRKEADAALAAAPSAAAPSKE